jgi:DNA (cytosine-5)-methyltransferase 1
MAKRQKQQRHDDPPRHSTEYPSTESVLAFATAHAGKILPACMVREMADVGSPQTHELFRRNGMRLLTHRECPKLLHAEQMLFWPEGAALPNAENTGMTRASAPSDVRPWKMASLFTGIGGFDLAFERAGFDASFQCEINPFCLTILEKHWPGVPRKTNIKEVRSDDIPSSDVWTAGFPCQDVSLARMGARAGLKGSRTGLFYEFARIVGEGRPGVVLLENVHGLLNSHGGQDFEIVVRTLADLGYSVGWRLLNSKNFGVPQSRKRVYIVGCHRDRSGPAKILFEPDGSQGDAEESRRDGKESVSPFKEIIGDVGGEGPVVQSIAYCLYACSARHTGTDWSRTYVSYPSRGDVRRLTARECEGIMGFPEAWTVPPGGVRQTEDTESLRYHALGNAVTPPVVEWLARRIKLYLDERKGG